MEITQFLFRAQRIAWCVRIAARKRNGWNEGARIRFGRYPGGDMDSKKSFKVAAQIKYYFNSESD